MVFSAHAGLLENLRNRFQVESAAIVRQENPDPSNWPVLVNYCCCNCLWTRSGFV